MNANNSSKPISVTEETLSVGLRFLSDRDPDLATILGEVGPPPIWGREPGFPTLVRIILEQEVSLASAKAAYDRLLNAATPLTPESFLQLDEITLKRIGFSGQKTRYCRHLAESLVEKSLNLTEFERMSDETVRTELLRLKGIGHWTVDIYLLMALRRPDVWPNGDLALAKAIQKVKCLDTRPTSGELNTIGAAWRPWRAVAARLLWHYYLTDPAGEGRIPKSLP